MGKSEGKRPLGEHRRRWEDGSSGSGMGGMDWIEMAQDRDRRRALVNESMNVGFHKMWGFLDWLRTG